MSETYAKQHLGPVYGVELIDTLPLSNGMCQQMPSREDLEQVREFSERTVAGYEVAIATIHKQRAALNRLESALLQIIRGRDGFQGPSLDYMQGYRDGQEHQARIARKALVHGG